MLWDEKRRLTRVAFSATRMNTTTHTRSSLIRREDRRPNRIFFRLKNHKKYIIDTRSVSLKVPKKKPFHYAQSYWGQFRPKRIDNRSDLIHFSAAHVITGWNGNIKIVWKHEACFRTDLEFEKKNLLHNHSTLIDAMHQCSWHWWISFVMTCSLATNFYSN